MPTGSARIKWVALSYSMPINPSKNRVYVWRKLKDIGAAPLNHGVAVLPKSSKKTGELVLLCEKIRQMGGEASIMEMFFASQRDELAMVSKFEQQSEQEYAALLRDCDKLLTSIHGAGELSDEATAEAIKRVFKQYGKARSRNHFGAPGQTELERAIDRIFDRCVADASGFASQLKKLIDKAKF